MNHPAKYEFNGQPITVREHEGTVAFAFKDIYSAIGFSNEKKLMRLYREYEKEFTEAETFMVPTVGTVGNRLYDTRLFNAIGAHHLGMLARTPQGAAFRMWIVKTFLAPLLNASVPATHASVKQITTRVQRRIRRSKYHCDECNALRGPNSLLMLCACCQRPEIEKKIKTKCKECGGAASRPFRRGYCNRCYQAKREARIVSLSMNLEKARAALAVKRAEAKVLAKKPTPPAPVHVAVTTHAAPAPQIAAPTPQPFDLPAAFADLKANLRAIVRNEIENYTQPRFSLDGDNGKPV